MTIKPIVVICERCGGRFEAQLKERPLPGGGAERRFRCPWCKAYYLVAVITPLGIKLFQQIRQVEGQVKQWPKDEGLRERLKELRRLLEPEVRGPDEPI